MIPETSIDFSSESGFRKSLKEQAPYVSDYAIGELTDRQISRLAVARVRNAQYRSFRIPKKSGGFRTITAPGGELKRLLKVVALALTRLYGNAPDAVNGFVPGCSVATNACMHVGKEYVMNIDLKDFFPSIRKHMVVESLVKKGVDRGAACLIARLCCHTPEDCSEDCLPQGAPTSPVLSNIVCASMDARLTALAQNFGLTYSRYADDITFSGDRNVFREGGRFRTALMSAVTACGFIVNDRKTRVQRPWERQEVTGVTVNSKVNISRKYLKNLRAELHNMQYRKVSMKEWEQVMGKVNYVRMLRRIENGADDYRTACLENEARAILLNIRLGC